MEDRIILESTEIEVICPRFVNLEHGWLGQVIVRTAFLKVLEALCTPNHSFSWGKESFRPMKKIF